MRYFAIVYKDFGYVLDYYPAECEAYFRENKRDIIGDFASYDAALAAVYDRLGGRARVGWP